MESLQTLAADATMYDEETLDPWWRFWDMRPESLPDPNSNQLIGTVGLVLISLGALGNIITLPYPIWAGKKMWTWDYIIWAAQIVFSFFAVWGWLQYGKAIELPNKRTTFRSWRTNWLAGFVLSGVTLLIAIYEFVWQVYWMEGYSGGVVQIWCSMSFFLATVLGWIFVFWLRGLWYNYDKYGIMRWEDFDWFALPDTFEYEDYVEAAETNDTSLDWFFAEPRYEPTSE